MANIAPDRDSDTVYGPAVHTRVTEEMKEEFALATRLMDMSGSQVLRRAVRDFIAQAKEAYPKEFKELAKKLKNKSAA